MFKENCAATPQRADILFARCTYAAVMRFGVTGGLTSHWTKRTFLYTQKSEDLNKALNAFKKGQTFVPASKLGK